MVVLLSAAIVLPWIVISSLSTSCWHSGSPVNDQADQVDDSSQVRTLSPVPIPQQWTAGKKGPWGQIESMLFAIDVPDEFVFVPPADQPPMRWSFPGYSKERVLATLRSVGVPEGEVRKVESSGHWNSDSNQMSVEPGDLLILSLAPSVRSKLYAILVTFPQNARQIDPIWFRPDNLDWRLQANGLAPESLSLMKRLLYAQGENMLLFTDFEPALRSLPGDAERRRFMKLVSRKQAVLARLRLSPDTDVEKLAQYWGVGGRRKDLLPFLGALHRVEKGCTINVICLLPDFPRDHLYRHPFSVTDDKSAKQDCFWSAFNFFNDPSDGRFNDMGYVGATLDRDYFKIQEASQLGDLVFLTVAGETAIHAAVYVADDLVFTKNGEDYRQPWILMHMADMVDTYAVKYPIRGSLKVQFFRRKGM
jgi:hypothetical protein